MLDVVLPSLVLAVNKSLESGVVPESLKPVLVTPVLKREGLNPECLSNYCRVSNVSFVSKFMERVVADQLSKHL